MPYGSDAKLGLAFQAAYGTAADVASLYALPFLSEDVTPQRPELISANNFGRFDEGQAYKGPQNVAGTIRAEATAQALGVFLKAVMGDPTASVVEGDVNEYVYKPRTADYDANVIANPLTYYKYLAEVSSTAALQFTDLVATGLELGVTNGQFLTNALTVVGGAVGKVSTVAITDDTSERFTWDVTSFQLGGAADIDHSDLTLTIDENASPRWTLQRKLDSGRVKRDGKRTIRLSGTVLYQDQDEYDDFIANTSKALVLHMEQNVTEIQSGYYDSVLIEIPSFKYLAYPTALDGPGELSVSFEGKAEYHAGSATAIAITLINTQAAY